MPSGPPELHQKWTNRRPYYGYGDFNAQRYLRKRGWTLHRDWTWTPPEPYYGRWTKLEVEALNYLVWEWDFGFVRETL